MAQKWIKQADGTFKPAGSTTKKWKKKADGTFEEVQGVSTTEGAGSTSGGITSPNKSGITVSGNQSGATSGLTGTGLSAGISKEQQARVTAEENILKQYGSYEQFQQKNATDNKTAAALILAPGATSATKNTLEKAEQGAYEKLIEDETYRLLSESYYAYEQELDDLGTKQQTVENSAFQALDDEAKRLVEITAEAWGGDISNSQKAMLRQELKERGYSYSKDEIATLVEYAAYDSEKATKKREKQQEKNQAWAAKQRKNLEIIRGLDSETKELLETSIYGYSEANKDVLSGNLFRQADIREGNKKNAAKALKKKGYSEDEIESLADTFTRAKNANDAKEWRAEVAERVNRSAVDAAANSVGSVFANLGSGAGLIPAATAWAEELVTGEYVPIDTNDPLYRPGEFRDITRTNVSRNIEDSVDSKVAKKILPMLYNAGMSTADTFTTSALGGMLGGTAAASEAMSLATMSAGAASSSTQEAFNRTGDTGKALATGIAAGVIEYATEKISLDHAWDIIRNSGSAVGKSWIVNLLAQSGIEGSEETASEIANRIVDDLVNGGMSQYNQNVRQYKDNGEDEKTAEKLATQDFLAQVLDSFSTGALAGFMGGGISTALSTKPSKKAQAVIDTEVDSRIATQEEKTGKKLKMKEKAAIREQVETALAKGDISIDTIEKTLGGETYEKYKAALEQEETLRKEFDTLNKMKQGEMTGEQLDRRAELKEQLKELEKSSNKEELKKQLSREVKELAGNDEFLRESYNEGERRRVAYQIDESVNYSKKQREIVQKAADSGILNNTRRTHEFVDLVARLAADKGVSFDFTDNQRLKESGFAIGGKHVNGFVKDGTITVNIESNQALDTVVGHEITHVLEGTELYSALQQAVKEYAKVRGEYDSRLAELTELYKGVEGANVENELTAELVGEYLFSDPDFVNQLAKKNRNLFQKLLREIRYMAKIATAGSREAQKLEELKRAFERAYRESNGTKAKSGVKYSLAGVDENGIEIYETSEDTKSLSYAERKAKLLDIMKNEYAGRTAKFTKNGETYYALYDGRGIKKGIYGDKKSDSKGYKAKINIGADGNYIELAENALYSGSASEQGKSNAFHKDAKSWDYYVKTVKSDGMYFDVLINVKDTGNSQFVYDVTMKEAMSLPDTVNVSYDGSSIASKNSVPQNQQNASENSKKSGGVRYSLSNNSEVTQSSEFKRWFGDWQNNPENASKVVNEDGTPKIIYHQTGTEFYEFSNANPKAGMNDSETPNGFFAKDNAADIGLEGNRQMALYGDMKKPLHFRNRAEARTWYEQNIEGYAELQKQYDNVDQKFNERFETQEQLNDEYYEQNYDAYVAGDWKVTNTFLSMEQELDDILTEWKEATDPIRRQQRELLNNYFLKSDSGYDGIILDVDGRRNGETVKSYIFFRNTQLKSATDNIGTFDGSNPDIRYSLSAQDDIAPINPRLTYGNDIALEQDNTIPIRQDIAGRERIVNKLTGEELDGNTYQVLDRLDKGETVAPQEIENLKEVKEGKEKTTDLSEEFVAQNPQFADIPLEKVGTYLINTEEREQLRNEIIEKRLSEGSYSGVDENGNEVYNGEVEKGRRLDIVIGLPASGKSSSIVNPLSQYYRSAVIDSDIIKQMLPEYNGGWGASLVHEESTAINMSLLEESMNGGNNIVLPIVGSKVSGVEKYINVAKNHGYSINIHLNELSNGKAVGRLLQRYFSTGRFINPVYAASYGNKPTAVYEAMKERGDIDGYSRWNNDVEYGQRPTCVENSDGLQNYRNFSDTWGRTGNADVGRNAGTVATTSAGESAEVNQRKEVSSQDGAFFDGENADSDGIDGIIFESGEETSSPFDTRDIREVGSRKVNAYMYENPEVKPYFQEEARAMLWELKNTVKGEKSFNSQLYYDTNGEQGWFGTKRETSDAIAELMDDYGYSYSDIEKGLKAIIEDQGAENIAVSKRIEFFLDERLRDGYTDFVTGMDIPPNQDYINTLETKRQAGNDTAGIPIRQDLPQAGTESGIPIRDDIAKTQDADPVRSDNAVAQDTGETDAMGPIRSDISSESDTGRKGKMRKWVETATESEAVNREILPEDLDQELIHYEPVSNRKTIQQADADLDRMGYDKALTVFRAKLESKRVSLSDVALGERLLQEAMKRGDKATAADLIQDIATLGTELGQKVQALSIIQRMTPEGQLKMLYKLVERGKAKGDKAFGGVEVTQDIANKILDVYKEDGSYDQSELNKAVEEAKQMIADQMPVSRMEKLNAWRYLSMLGNPKTHDRNIISNVTMKAAVAAKNALARTMETVLPVRERTKTWRPATKTVREFAKQTTAEMAGVLSGENSYSETASIKSKRDVFKNKVLQKVYDFNSDMLTKEDWWFKRSAFRNAFREFLTANGIRTQEDINNHPETVEKAKKYAVEQAEIATFQQYSWLASKINDIERKNAATQMVVGAVIPFKKTPINIAKTGLSYSPLGFAKTLSYDLFQMKQGNMDASTVIDHLSQNMVGSALVYAGYMLAMSGLLNGGGEDDEEAKYDYQLGEQSYSINLGGATYSLSWLTPAAIPLFVGANVYEMFEEGKEFTFDTTADALAKTLDPMSEMSFLLSLDSVLSSYDSGMAKFAGIGEAMLQSYTSQFIPTLSSQIAATLDDTKRSTKASGDSTAEVPEETLRKLMYKIPGLRSLLEPSTDIWGNEVKQSDSFPVRAFESFLAPYAKRENIENEIDEELKEVYSQTGDGSLLPKVPSGSVTFDNEKYRMSAGEYTAYKKTYGQTANKLLGELFATTAYRNADDSEKADMIGRVYDYARDEAKKEYLAKEGVEYTNAKKDKKAVYKEDKIKGAVENDMTLEEFDLFSKSKGKYYISKALGGIKVYDPYVSEINAIKGDKDASGNTLSGSRKNKVADYINSLPLSYEQKILLFTSVYPSEDSYKRDIIKYLNSRDDISYSEMVEILEELDCRVTDDGKVYW